MGFGGGEEGPQWGQVNWDEAPPKHPQPHQALAVACRWFLQLGSNNRSLFATDRSGKSMGEAGDFRLVHSISRLRSESVINYSAAHDVMSL